MPRKPSDKLQQESRQELLLVPGKGMATKIAKELKLDVEQTHALAEAIDSINAFAETIIELEQKVPLRKDRVRQLDRIEKTLRRLNKQVAEAGGDLEYILPPAVGAYLCGAFNFTAISKASGADRFPQNLGRTIEKLLARDGQLTMQALEKELGHRHRALGIEYGHLFFKTIIYDLHQAMSEWRDAQRKSLGGRHSEWSRDLVLDQLIKSSNAIIGKRATSTFGGPFSDLCQAVMVEYGQSIEGLEKAIAAKLKRMKEGVA